MIPGFTMPRQLIRDGLVGWWPLDEGTGTTANDRSGKGNHGTIYNGSWLSTHSGPGLSFNGLATGGTQVIVPTSADFDLAENSDLAVVMDILPNTIGDYYLVFIGTTGTFVNYCTYMNAGGIAGFGSQSGGTNRTCSGFDVAWHTLIFNNVGANVYIFLDSIQQGVALTNNNSGRASNSVLRMGGDKNSGSTYMYAGVMKNVRIYNRALSNSEVGAIFRREG
jgi:hypothetical protein